MGRLSERNGTGPPACNSRQRSGGTWGPRLPGALAKEGGGGADGGDGGDHLLRLLGSPRDVLARAVGLIAAAEDLLMAPPVALPAHAAGRSS